MADNMLQIHELVPLGRDLTGTDVLAVDTGALTAKVDYGSMKQAITADSVSTTQFDASAVKFSAAQSLTDAQKAQARGNIGAASASDVGTVPSGANLQGEVDELKSAVQLDEKYALLLHDEIPGTTQTIAFDSSGNVSTITHTNGNNVAVRTDAFTFATNSITEVRTLNTGETLTIVTNTTTLATAVTYAAAA